MSITWQCMRDRLEELGLGRAGDGDCGANLDDDPIVYLRIAQDFNVRVCFSVSENIYLFTIDSDKYEQAAVCRVMELESIGEIVGVYSKIYKRYGYIPCFAGGA